LRLGGSTGVGNLGESRPKKGMNREKKKKSSSGGKEEARTLTYGGRQIGHQTRTKVGEKGVNKEMVEGPGQLKKKRKNTDQEVPCKKKKTSGHHV